MLRAERDRLVRLRRRALVRRQRGLLYWLWALMAGLMLAMLAFLVYFAAAGYRNSVEAPVRALVLGRRQLDLLHLFAPEHLLSYDGVDSQELRARSIADDDTDTWTSFHRLTPAEHEDVKGRNVRYVTMIHARGLRHSRHTPDEHEQLVQHLETFDAAHPRETSRKRFWANASVQELARAQQQKRQAVQNKEEQQEEEDDDAQRKRVPSCHCHNFLSGSAPRLHQVHPYRLDAGLDMDDGLSATQLAPVFESSRETWNEWLERSSEGTTIGALLSTTQTLPNDDLSDDEGDGTFGVYSSVLSGSTLGVTFLLTSGDRIVEWDMVYDEDRNWASNGGSGTFDRQAVITHEFGHAIGLGHVDASCPEATMYFSVSSGETKKRSLELCSDVAGVEELYSGLVVSTGERLETIFWTFATLLILLVWLY